MPLVTEDNDFGKVEQLLWMDPIPLLAELEDARLGNEVADMELLRIPRRTSSSAISEK